MVSPWCELLCKLSICTLSDQRITIWWAKFELECVLLMVIYYISKFKVSCKKADFRYWFIRTHTKENHLKFLTFHSPFSLFLMKILWRDYQWLSIPNFTFFQIPRFFCIFRENCTVITYQYNNSLRNSIFLERQFFTVGNQLPIINSSQCKKSFKSWFSEVLVYFSIWGFWDSKIFNIILLFKWFYVFYWKRNTQF